MLSLFKFLFLASKAILSYISYVPDVRTLCVIEYANRMTVGQFVSWISYSVAYSSFFFLISIQYSIYDMYKWIDHIIQISISKKKYRDRMFYAAFPLDYSHQRHNKYFLYSVQSHIYIFLTNSIFYRKMSQIILFSWSLCTESLIFSLMIKPNCIRT